MEVKTYGNKTTFVNGKDRYTTGNRARAVEVFKNWLNGERLPKPKLKL